MPGQRRFADIPGGLNDGVYSLAEVFIRQPDNRAGSYGGVFVNRGFDFRRVGASEVQRLGIAAGYDLVKQVYISFIANRMCYLHRGRPLWHNNAFEETDAEGPVHIALSRDGDGAPDGYMVYTLRYDRRDHPSRSQEIRIRDLAWLTPSAYRSLWSFVKRHDLVGSVRWNNAPADDPALEFFLEPRLLNARDDEGMWLRIVDVPTSLAGRGWDADGVIGFPVPAECARRGARPGRHSPTYPPGHSVSGSYSRSPRNR